MISPADLVHDAHGLSVPEVVPARARSIVSRAYYAAFHMCMARANAVGFVHRGGGTHRKLHEFMRNDEDLILRRVEPLLTALYNKRIDADYRLAATVDSSTATDALEEMSEIVDALSPA